MRRFSFKFNRSFLAVFAGTLLCVSFLTGVVAASDRAFVRSLKTITPAATDMPLVSIAFPDFLHPLNPPNQDEQKLKFAEALTRVLKENNVEDDVEWVTKLAENTYEYIFGLDPENEFYSCYVNILTAKYGKDKCDHFLSYARYYFDPGTYEEPNSNKLLTAENYDYSAPIPESEAVDDSYFADALFIGDSRTVGFGNYINNYKNQFGINVSLTYYADVGLHHNDALNKEFLVGEDGENVTILKKIEENPDFKKVYICIGLNDMGSNHRVVMYSYKTLISKIRDILPEADIYVQSIIPVTERASENSRFGVTNDAIRSFNSLLLQMANETKSFYIDSASVFSNEKGALPDGVGESDGIHLGPTPCKQLYDYLKTHTVVFGETVAIGE